MYQPITIFIGLRYIYGHTIRCFNNFTFWLSAIGIVLGVMALVTLLSVMNGFEQELQNNILRLIPQALLLSTNKSINPQQLPNKIIKLRGISYITPLTISNVLIQSTHNIALGVMLGIDPMQKDPLTIYLTNIKQIDLTKNKYNVILGRQLAKQLGVEQGDQLRIIVPSVNQFTLVGHFPSQRLFNVIGTFTTNSEIDNYQILVNIKKASRLMRYKIGNITGWRLWLEEPLKVDKLSQQKLPEGIKWKDWREHKGELFQAMHMEKNIIKLLLSLIIVVSIFNVIASLHLITIEKKVDIAILQTQGMAIYQIVIIFIVQGTFMSFIGVLLGSILGLLITSQLNNLIQIINLLPDDILLPIVIKPSQIANIALTTVFITVLFILYPSWQAARIQPVRALRYE